MANFDPSALDLEHVHPRFAAASWSVFYVNDAGVETFRCESDTAAWYLKVAPVGVEPALSSEAERMAWVRTFLPAPEVLGSGEGQGGVTWMLTAALPGHSGLHTPLRQTPSALAEAIGRGLRRFHQLPIDACPYAYRRDEALARARSLVQLGRVIPTTHFQPHQRHWSADEALRVLLNTRLPPEDLVVCHGDACTPNMLFDDGEVCGYVDLGGVAVADRWWDLAIASRSIEWNLGTAAIDDFLHAYGVAQDPVRRDFYRLLHDVTVL